VVSWAKTDGVEMPRPFAINQNVVNMARHESMLVQADNAAKISDSGHPFLFFFRQNSSMLAGAGTLIPA